MDRIGRWIVFAAVVLLLSGTGRGGEPEPFPGTQPLTLKGDIASQLVAGVDTFLLREIDRSVSERPRHWHRNLSSYEKYSASIAPNRRRLAHILGIRDERVPFDQPEIVAGIGQSPQVARGRDYEIYAVRWPAFGDVHGEGLLLVPSGRKAVASIVVIPDADQNPEQLVGLARDGVNMREGSFPARRLAESGYRVLVPMLISRQLSKRGGAVMSNREFIYRPAFELGRHPIGYEVQKVLAAVDWLTREATPHAPAIGVFGYGEGGLLALYAAALDERINAVCVSGYFDNRAHIWQEPIERNVFGLLSEFGDAELASMVAPRTLIVEACRGPEVTLPSEGGAPGRLVTPRLEDVRHEFERAKLLTAGLKPAPGLQLVVSGEGSGPFGTSPAMNSLIAALVPHARLAEPGPAPDVLRTVDPLARQQRQVHELDRHSQWVLRESPYVRQEFMKNLDLGDPKRPSPDRIARYEKSAEPYREFFYENVIGHFDNTVLPPKIRTRKKYSGDNWTGYEVVMDVFPDVIAYGILLLPNDLKKGERRPVVVCQHGLEGRPQDTIGDPGYHFYSAFAARLAERGFITFAPQNLYIFNDRFRTLQRKANPLGKTLFSIIVPQHQQIVDWLQTLPMVDAKRIAFYGLSYGGKTAMRVPPLVKNYCLSICSADFNEWVDKNASTRSPYSYVWSREYEIFEFDLGSTFNYAEMAALIAPRPFMVERGHFDGVAADSTVAYEFAKIRYLYAARLGLPDRCAIEWFVGPHTIHGQGTYDFLSKHLNWPRPTVRSASAASPLGQP